MTTSVTSVTEYNNSHGGTGANRSLCASDGLLFIVLPEIPFQMLISCSLLLLLVALAVLHSNYLSKVFSKQMCSFLIFGLFLLQARKRKVIMGYLWTKVHFFFQMKNDHICYFSHWTETFNCVCLKCLISSICTGSQMVRAFFWHPHAHSQGDTGDLCLSHAAGWH